MVFGQESDAESSQSISILLRVENQGGRASRIFRCETTTRMEFLMDAYCDRKHVDRKTTVFFFGGVRIKDWDTPRELHMEDCSVIDAVVKGDDRGSPSIWMDLTVKDQGGRSPVRFTCNKTQPLTNLMKIYCDEKCVDRNTTQFIFGGVGIEDYDTPDELHMKDDEVIQALVEGCDESIQMAHITIKVQDKGGRLPVYVRCKTTFRLEIVLKDYCLLMGIDRETTEFSYGGVRIEYYNTPDQLRMKDRDVVDALVKADNYESSQSTTHVIESGGGVRIGVASPPDEDVIDAFVDGDA